MKNIFSYESKFMQTLLIVADYIILNVVFILCCLPVITIGAAQAGLYTGIRKLRDKEDDSSCLKAFFHGFANGFGKITVVWCFLSVCIALLGYNLIAVLIFNYAGFAAPVWICVAGMTICIIYQSMVTLFHANFGCTAFQLLKNVFFVALAHPLRSIAVAIIAWAPVAVFLLNTPLFLQGTIAWLAAYYSLAFTLNIIIMEKPFRIFTENFTAEKEPQETN